MEKYSGLKKQFLKKVNRAAERTFYSSPADLNPISSLPVILQKYLHASGYDFSVPIDCTKINWKKTMLRFNPESKWVKINCYQINFLWEPVRLVYMKSLFWGLFPLEGIDSYTQGQGNMLVRLMGLFKLTDAKGKEMDAAELVTVLAEVMLIPHYALRKYITWEQIDEFTLRATLNHNTLKVTGVFYFNTEGECTSFETDDRRYTNKNNEYIKMKWIASVEQYKIQDGIKFPAQFSASWKTDNGDYQYFKGNVDSIVLNKHVYDDM